MRIEEEKTREVSRPFGGVFPKGSLWPIYGHTAPHPLPPSSSPFLTHSLCLPSNPPVSLSLSLFFGNIPSLNVQPVCPSRLNVPRQGWILLMAGVTNMDREGTLSTKTNKHAKETRTKNAGESSKPRNEANHRQDPRCQCGEEPREGTDDRATSIWNGRQQHKGLALNSGSVHPVFRLPVHCHTGVQ